MSRWPVVLAAALLAISASAPGWAAQPKPVPDRKPDLSPMMFKLGTWTCHQRVRGGDRPDTETYAVALDGRWIVGHDVAPPFDRFRTKAVVSEDRITFNPLTKQWVDIYSDSFGGYYITTSPGWIGRRPSDRHLFQRWLDGQVRRNQGQRHRRRFAYTVRDKTGKPTHGDGICKKSP